VTVVRTAWRPGWLTSTVRTPVATASITAGVNPTSRSSTRTSAPSTFARTTMAPVAGGSGSRATPTAVTTPGATSTSTRSV
jgi:hypothetical protein